MNLLIDIIGIGAIAVIVALVRAEGRRNMERMDAMLRRFEQQDDERNAA